MTAVSLRRVLLCTLAGGLAWGIWSTIINMAILAPKYAIAQKAGVMLAQPRYPLFVGYWFVMLFILTYILTWAYVSVRPAFGPGPLTALRVGFLMGFMCGFPLSLTLATWAPFSRIITVWWLMDLWVGSMIATMVSAWLYKEA